MILNTSIRVGAYDTLLVDIKVISKLNEEINVYFPDSYEIVKVHRVIYRRIPKQEKLEGNGF